MITATIVAAFGAHPAMAAEPLPADTSLVVSGGGWGHGHGMSQYGARAQAEAGRTWQQILHSYYSGVSIVDRGTESLRVLVTSGSSVAFGGPESYTAKWSGGTTIASNTSTNPYMRVRATSGGVAVDRGPKPSGPWTQIASGTRNVFFYPANGLMPVIQGPQLRYYRGYMQAYRRSSTTMYALNHLTMDRYLYGVVPREMPASWHSTGLRAQAVAARSYSAWKKANASSSAAYDICATTQCQVYGGYGYRTSPTASMTVLEHSRTNDAIDATSGLTMVSGGEPIFAEFHSSSGGHTSQGSRSYLAPVADPWDAEYSPHHRWTARIPVSAVEGRWPAIGRLTSITSIQRDGDGPWGGRVLSMVLNGTAGSQTISGGAFNSAFYWPGYSHGTRSRLFTVGIYNATPSGSVPEVQVQPGQTASVTVRLRNTGNRSWKAGSVVQLGTASPNDRSSIFASSSWISSSRATALASDETGDDVVSPGEVGVFRFSISAPAGTGTGVYVERFRGVASGLTWFGTPVAVTVRVGTDGGSQLGGNLVDNASFEGAVGGDPNLWTPANVADADGQVLGGVDGSSAIRLTGARGKTVAFTQAIPTGGRPSERLIVSGWSRTSGTTSAGGSIEIRAIAKYKDGTTTSYALGFPRGGHGWTYRERAFTIDRWYRSLVIQVRATDQSGVAWFDRVRLVRERIADPSFESSSTSVWTLKNTASTDGRDAHVARAGLASLRLTARGGVSVYARQSSSFAAPAGTHLRLGGWSRTAGTDPAKGPVMVWARLANTDGTTQTIKVEFPRDDHDWRYREAIATAKKDFKGVTLYAYVSSQSGRAWFDELSFGWAPTVRPLNENGGFEQGAPRPSAWSFSPTTATEPIASAAAAGSAALHLAGDPTRLVSAKQVLPLAGPAGDTFVLSATNRTVGATSDGGRVRAWVRVRHQDGTYAWPAIDFDRAAHDWTKLTLRFSTAKPYVGVEVFLGYEKQTGDAYFDEVRLTPIVI